MQVDIKFEKSPIIQTKAIFELASFKSDLDYKETLGIIFMISADYYLDPELEIDDLRGFVTQGQENSKDKLTLFVSEDGLELEFS